MRSRPGESARDAEREEMLESAGGEYEPASDAEREEMLESAGGEYEPARFDLAAAHAAVAAV